MLKLISGQPPLGPRLLLDGEDVTSALCIKSINVGEITYGEPVTLTLEVYANAELEILPENVTVIVNDPASPAHDPVGKPDPMITQLVLAPNHKARVETVGQLTEITIEPARDAASIRGHDIMADLEAMGCMPTTAPDLGDGQETVPGYLTQPPSMVKAVAQGLDLGNLSEYGLGTYCKECVGYAPVCDCGRVVPEMAEPDTLIEGECHNGITPGDLTGQRLCGCAVCKGDGETSKPYTGAVRKP